MKLLKLQIKNFKESKERIYYNSEIPYLPKFIKEMKEGLYQDLIFKRNGIIIITDILMIQIQKEIFQLNVKLRIKIMLLM